MLDTAIAQTTLRGGYVASMRMGECSWSGAAGTAAPDVPLLPSHLVRIASVTKTYVAAALIQLAMDGAFSLDDPISDHVTTGLANEDVITVRQLARTLSGLG